MAAQRKKSRKRSATKAGPPPEPIILFVDRSLGRLVAERLRAAGATVEHHDDHFAENTPDVDWIAEVGRRRWVVLTKDKRIRRNPLERRAVAAAELRLFSLSGGNMTGAQMAEVFEANLARIEQFTRRTPPPFAALVSASGVRILPTFRRAETEGEEEPS